MKKYLNVASKCNKSSALAQEFHKCNHFSNTTHGSHVKSLIKVTYSDRTFGKR